MKYVGAPFKEEHVRFKTDMLYRMWRAVPVVGTPTCFQKYKIKYLFAQGGSQTPHPFFLPSPDLFFVLVCKFSRQRAPNVF
jgi:hypothetical protein